MKTARNGERPEDEGAEEQLQRIADAGSVITGSGRTIHCLTVIGQIEGHYLLPEGPVFRQNPRWWFETVYESDADCVDLPMVTLVNADSYSAAELLSAELREFSGTPVVGERTSGKGYSQITFPLSNGGAIGLSTATYCTGEGNSLIGVGIVPDVEVERSGTEDSQLQAAIQLLQKTE